MEQKEKMFNSFINDSKYFPLIKKNNNINFSGYNTSRNKINKNNNLVFNFKTNNYKFSNNNDYDNFNLNKEKNFLNNNS